MLRADAHRNYDAILVRATGKIGVVGVYEPSDEGAATEDAKHGRYDFDYGTAFTKGITIAPRGQGQTCRPDGGQPGPREIAVPGTC